jgi:hypothetical protein
LRARRRENSVRMTMKLATMVATVHGFHIALYLLACGGHKHDLCFVFGRDNPIFPQPDMNSDFAEEACRLKRVAQTALYCEKKKASKCSSNVADLPFLLESVTITGPTSA